MATRTATNATISDLRQRARATWSAGDYDAIAGGLWPVGELVVAQVGVAPGDRVVDIAAGTGNAAIRAAQAGGSVTALDVTPELFPAGRRRAAEAGVEIEWVEGDAEQLPFAEASFDVVLSTFGVMFAARHAVAANEMMRVLRPGGRIGLATWTPDGAVADLFRALAAEMPSAPGVDAPLAWGEPAYVQSLLDGLTLEFTVEQLPGDPEVDAAPIVDFYLDSFGPLVMARRTLAPAGRWPMFTSRIRPVIERLIREPATYLQTTGRKTSGSDGSS